MMKLYTETASPFGVLSEALPGAPAAPGGAPAAAPPTAPPAN
jgi:hypothetical protein